ncbi:DUF805 domain-containing protein [Microbacterium sp. NPDC016588]
MSSSVSAPPLDQPYYGAPLGAAVRRFFAKYATFTGRASRSEYWWWWLVAAVVNFVLQILALVTGGLKAGSDGAVVVGTGLGIVFLVLVIIWGLGTIVPGIAVLVRRLHDSNHSGFWVFIGLVPLVGGLILFIFTLLGPNPEGARFDR